MLCGEREVRIAMHDYLTLGARAEAEFTVSRSRFIGYAAPVTDADAANAFVAEIRAMHREARHNVYAYIVREPAYSRFSDDGEPQGTAGKPVLDVLKKPELEDACIVVTRYFGGILLGTGGLVRAYSHAAHLAVEAAGIVCMRACAVYALSFSYALYEPVLQLLPYHRAVAEDTSFGEAVTLTARLPLENEAAFLTALSERTLGRAEVKRLGEKYDRFSTE